MKLERLFTSLAIGLGLVLTILWLLVTESPTPVYAGSTYSVTNTNAVGPGSLRQAIIDANASVGHDTIDFSITGTVVLTGALPVIEDDLTIIGLGFDELAISGANAYSVFEIGNGAIVTITQLTVRDGNRGVSVGPDSALNMSSSRLVSNSTSSQGGGLYVDQRGRAALIETQVLSSHRGGIYIDEGAVLTMTGGVIANNLDASISSGGGLFIYYGNATLNGVQVFNNSADSRGGGIYAFVSRVELTDTQVVSNSASYGGGIYIQGYIEEHSVLTMTGGGIANNFSPSTGGGLYALHGDTTLSGVQVFNNSADSRGGGICFYEGNAALIETQVISNSASRGGGIYIDELSAVTVTSGLIADNLAFGTLYVDAGGGLYIDDGKVTLTGTQVLSNSAANKGGGIYSFEGRVVMTRAYVFGNSAVYEGGGLNVWGDTTLNETEIVSNSASSGGGVAGTFVTIIGGTVSSNSVTLSGGGLYVYNGQSNVIGGRIIGNSSGLRGGGVEVYEGTVTLTETLVANNSSGLGGGLSSMAATLNVNGGEISSNSASNGGGVFPNNWGHVTLTGTRLISNTALANGGGIYAYRWGSARLNGTQLINNSASSSGGAACVTNATLNINGGSIEKNSAGSGGGVYVEMGKAVLSSTRVISNSASASGGLFLLDPNGAITITDSCIVYNTDTAVYNDDLGILEASNNWWGAGDGPSGAGLGSGDSVSANVGYVPFKTSAPAGCLTYLPDLSITKSLTPTTDVAYHDIVTYTVMLDNAGWVSDTNVLFTDTLPPEVDFASWVISPTNTLLDGAADEITWAGTVTGGEILTWSFTALHTGEYDDRVTNTAEFSGTLQAGEDDAILTVVEKPRVYLPVICNQWQP